MQQPTKLKTGFPARLLCRLLLVAVTALLPASCVLDGERISPAPEGEEVEVLLKLRTRGLDGQGAPPTRATSADEAAVENVLAFFFLKETGILYTAAVGTELENAPVVDDGDGGGTATFKAGISVEGQYANSEFSILVLANALDLPISGSGFSGRAGGQTTLSREALTALCRDGGLTRDDLCALLVTDVDAASFHRGTEEATSPMRFTLWGEAEETMIPSQTKGKNYALNLIRDAARVNIGVAQEVTNFTLEEAYIFRAEQKLSLLPNSLGGSDGNQPNYDAQARKVNFPTVPTDSEKDEVAEAVTKWKYTTTTGLFANTIYIPEADTHLGDNAAPGDGNHENRCAVVVGGTFGDNIRGYYRIDFKLTLPGGTDDAPLQELMDVLRNHSYNITITEVRSGGAGTPEEAYKSSSADITAEIIEWTDNNQEIVFDGENWASVESKTVHFLDGAGLTVNLGLLASIKPSEWTMTLTDPSGGTTEMPEGTATVTDAYFTVTKPTGDDSLDPGGGKKYGGTLTITTRQNMAGQTEPRESILTVNMNRLSLQIRLIQHPMDDMDWENGSDYDVMY